MGRSASGRRSAEQHNENGKSLMKGRRVLLILVALAAVLFVIPAGAHAQYQRPSVNPRLNTLRRPTVSPYLELLRQGGAPIQGLPTYQTRVQPQLQQGRVNRQQQAQIQRLQAQVARQGTLERGGAFELRTTGHRSFFMNYSHFYTGLRTPR